MNILSKSCRWIRISYEYVPQFTIEVRQVILQAPQLVRKIAKRLFSRDQSQWPSINIDHRRKLKDDNQKKRSIIGVQLAGNFAQGEVIQHRAYLFAGYRNNSIPLCLTGVGICYLSKLHGAKQRGRSMHRLRESNDSNMLCLCLRSYASFIRCCNLSLDRSPSNDRCYQGYTRDYDVASKSEPVGGPNILLENVWHGSGRKCGQCGRKRNDPDRREAWKVVSFHGVNLPRDSAFVERVAA